MTKDIIYNEIRRITFISMLESDSMNRAFHSTTRLSDRKLLRKEAGLRAYTLRQPDGSLEQVIGCVTAWTLTGYSSKNHVMLLNTGQ